MKDADAHTLGTYIRSERLKLIHYVRSLLRESAAMDAEDLVHDVLLRILEKADLIVPADNAAAYVYRSLKNRVIDYMRSKKPTVSLDGSIDVSLDGNAEDDGKLIDLLFDGAPNALEVLQTQEGEAALFAALQVLSEMERKVVIAHELEGTPFNELARAWNVPQNTLLSHKARAIKKLKKQLSST